MEGLRRSIERGAVAVTDHVRSNGNGNAWQKPVIAALWAVLLIGAGWVYSDARDTRKTVQATVKALETTDQESLQRIAVLEENARNVREALKRIEEGINELRRERRP